jgi:hypothetical protein
MPASVPVMGAIHDLIESEGKQGALALGADRIVVEAAASYMADEDAGMAAALASSCFTFRARPSGRAHAKSAWVGR